MTNLQLKILHIAKRDRKIDEPDWRTILRSIGHVQSSKELSNAGFEDVMAYLEGQGYRQPGKPETYWRDTQANRGQAADRRQLHLIAELAAQTTYKLPGLCRRVSQQRTDQPEQLTPREAHNLIEMLKSIIARLEPSPADPFQEPATAEAQPELW